MRHARLATYLLSLLVLSGCGGCWDSWYEPFPGGTLTYDWATLPDSVYRAVSEDYIDEAEDMLQDTSVVSITPDQAAHLMQRSLTEVDERVLSPDSGRSFFLIRGLGFLHTPQDYEVRQSNDSLHVIHDALTGGIPMSMKRYPLVIQLKKSPSIVYHTAFGAM